MKLVRTPSMRTTIAAVLAAALVLPLSTLGVASSASADALAVTGGELSWSVDTDYAAIFTGRAKEDPASWTSDGTTATFPVDTATSGYDATARTGTLSFSGALRLGYVAGSPTAEPGSAAGNYFYVEQPRIVLDGDTGTLLAGTVAGSSHDLVTGLPTHAGTGVAIATLDLSGVTETTTDATIAWEDVPVAITAAGATYLAHYDSAEDEAPTVRAVGSLLAPISFAVDMGTTAAPELPEVPQPSSVYTYDSTTSTGYVVRDLAVDPRHGVIWYPYNWSVTSTSGTSSIGSMDADTGEPTDVSIPVDAEPESLLIDSDAARLYVLHYRGATSAATTASMTVIDTDTNVVIREVAGIPRYATAPVLDIASGMIYFGATTSDRTTSDSLYGIDTATGALSEWRLPGGNQADLAGLALDEDGHRLYVSSKVETAIWMFDTELGAFAGDFAELPRPGDLAFDSARHRLFAVTNAFNGQDQAIRVFDTNTGDVTAASIAVGNTVRDIQVVEASGLLAVVNGFSNTVSIVQAPTRSVIDTIDFGDLGVTDPIPANPTVGQRSLYSDVWAVGVDQETERLFVSHPYWVDGISILDRTGDVAEDDGNDTAEIPADTETPGSTAPDAPAAPAVSTAPADSRTISAGSFSWGMSEYARSFSQKFGFGDASFDNESNFSFGNGTGWYQSATGALSVTWSGVVQYRPYGSIAPVELVFANPILEADGSGRGTLSFDVRSNNGSGVESAYKRVVVATFGISPAIDGDTATFTVSPDYAGRLYTNPTTGAVSPDSFPAAFIDFLHQDLRGWWSTTGANLDRLKPPTSIAGRFALSAVEVAQNPIPTETTAPAETPAVTPTAPIASSVVVTVPTATFGKAAKASVRVTAGGAAATGSATVSVGGKAVKTVALTAGTATVALPKTLKVGRHGIVVTYAGSATTAASTGTATVRVAKAKAKVAVKLVKTLKKGTKATARITVTVPGTSVKPAGTVTVRVNGKVVDRVKVKAANKSVVRVKLPRFGKLGTAKVTATFAATTSTKAATSATAKVRVR